MAVEVLVTGGDTELGRVVAEGFHNEGHAVTLLGARRDDLEVAAKEIEADAIVCDNTDPAALAEVRHLFPHHLDTIVNIPAPRWSSGDPRAYSLSDLAAAWRNSLDDTVLSAVLTLDTVGVGELIQIAAERGRQTRPNLKLGICGEHGGDPASIRFCETVGLDYVSCSPYRVPIARLAAAQAVIQSKARGK